VFHPWLKINSMPTLASDLRRQLESVVVQARDLTEAAARAALKRWAVDVPKPFDHFSAVDKQLRNRLRARGKQAGDRPDEATKNQEIDRLTEELAYEYWHRMLFARFLAENNLLMHPDGVAVTLAECEELAPSENAVNGFVLAARYASRMLPEIFRIGDVLLEVEFPINDRLPLERLLASLPTQVFTADDSLGWVYQFWQTKKKEEVNKSGQKIDGRTLPAVTQLFTEHYMVEFLLHNTIGAWWAAKEGIEPRIKHGSNTDEKIEYLNGIDPCLIRVQSVAKLHFEYLRWRDDGTPAAGKFEGWPRTLKEFTMLDPCCGSGHFLVAGFNLLVPLRMHDEGLSAADAVDAVLRDNLFGLELDPRCTQIAAFALAMAAWKTPGEDGRPLGYRPLPPLNIACSGQGVVGTKEQWTRIANGDNRFREGMERLYDLFQKAPTLGSLIDPRTVAEDLFALGFDMLKGTLDRALKKIETQTDPDRAAVGVAAQGIALAASLMAREFTLVATNVPYLGKRGGVADELKRYMSEVHPAAKSDLATSFVERCLDYCSSGGVIALVTPQNWLSLPSYRELRGRLLKEFSWNTIARLGPGAFETISGEVVKPCLCAISKVVPSREQVLFGLDVSGIRTAVAKAEALITEKLLVSSQVTQSQNPDSRVVLESYERGTLLGVYTLNPQGIKTGDDDCWKRCFWESAAIGGGWEFYQSTVKRNIYYGGREHIIDWSHDGLGMVRPRKGSNAIGNAGVAVSQMGALPVTIYTGERFDSNVAAIVPKDRSHASAIWCFCRSTEFHVAVRRIDKSLKVTNDTLVKVPFDLERWQQVAAEQYPNGLPEPHSDDPTQWLFTGHPNASADPLQVAVARLLGYCWPDQEPDDLDAPADKDGIVPIPSARGESPAVERLREVLRIAFGSEWSASLETKLLSDAGVKPGTSLDDWLRNLFFEQHCKRFHNRPFVWHLWDGRKDGFSCLVNYHKLDHKLMEILTYSYLQDWITAQAAAAKSGQTGADLRLAAAQEMQDKLKLILAGEPPYDIFVRWKPLAEQPIGWNPDLNDGVRLNIRPFMTAGILRKNPNIKWTKDRGTEPKRDKDQFPWFWNGDTFTGERVNDVHLTIKDKQSHGLNTDQTRIKIN
jgi:hypothetical protein